MQKFIFKNNTVTDGGTFLQSDVPIHVEASGNTFENVERPFDLAEGSTGEFRDNRILRDPKLGLAHGLSQGRRDGVSKGWRQLKGPPLPVFCPNCGHVFPSKNYVFAGTYFYCWGNTEECVNCGYEKAELSKGVFDLSHETVIALRAPEITHDMIRRLSELGELAISGKLVPDKVIKAATEIHPTFGATIKRWIGTPGYSLMFFFAVVTGVNETWELAGRLKDFSAVQSVVKHAFNSLQQANDPVPGSDEWNESQGKNQPNSETILDQQLGHEDEAHSEKGSSVEGIEPSSEGPIPIPERKPHS